MKKLLTAIILTLLLTAQAFALDIVRLGPEYFPNPDRSGAIGSGYIYVGEPDLDPTVPANQKQITIQQEDGALVEVTQPLRTNSGGTPIYNGSAVTLLVNGDYSLLVQSSSTAQKYYIPSAQIGVGEITLSLDKKYNCDLSSALTDIGAVDQTTLTVDCECTLDDGESLISTSNIALEIPNGGSIDGVSGGATETLYINGPFSPGPNRMFLDNLTVELSGKTTHVYPDNWEENTTPGTTNMTTGFEKAIAATQNKGIPIHLLPETYIIGDIEVLETDPVTGVGTAGPVFLGASDNSDWVAPNPIGGTILRSAVGSTYMFKYGDEATNSVILRAMFSDLTMDGVDRTRGGCINSSDSKVSRFENVHITNFTYGFLCIKADRLTMEKVWFTDNTYGFWYDEAIHGDTPNASGISLIDVHHRNNDYNMYFDGDKTDFEFHLRGGYWSGSSNGDFFITGAMSVLTLDGVNLENASNGTIATKPAVFQLGQVHKDDHTGIRLVRITNCKIRDNNTVGTLMPILMTIVDSTSTSEPSVELLDIDGNVILNYINGLVVDPDGVTELTASHCATAFWRANHSPVSVPPPASTIWRESAEASSGGAGKTTQHSTRLYNSPIIKSVLNRTAALTTRISEVDGHYTNEGAAGVITFTLLPAVVGYEYTFTVLENAKVIRVDPASGQGFVGGSGADKYVQTDSTLGSSMRIRCLSTTPGKEWHVVAEQGSLTYEP